MTSRAALRTAAIRARRLRYGVIDQNHHEPALLRRLPRGSVVVAHLDIGEGTGISGPISVKGPGTCSIGRYGALGSEIVIHTGNHPMHRPAVQYSLYRNRDWPDGEDTTGNVEIGHDVWIGDRALVMPNCIVGNGAVIGAGAIVTRDVPPYSVVAGVPATHVRFRFDPQVIAFLEEVAWWEWSPAEIDERRAFFEADLTTCEPLTLRRLLSPS